MRLLVPVESGALPEQLLQGQIDGLATFHYGCLDRRRQAVATDDQGQIASGKVLGLGETSEGNARAQLAGPSSRISEGPDPGHVGARRGLSGDDLGLNTPAPALEVGLDGENIRVRLICGDIDCARQGGSVEFDSADLARNAPCTDQGRG